MDGHLAFEPCEYENSLSMLAGEIDPDDLYVVFGSFEGQWEVMRFDTFSHADRLPTHSLPRGDRYQDDLSKSWRSLIDRDAYIAYVEEIRQEIAKGWVYQVNACRLLRSDSFHALDQLFRLIQEEHPAPAAGYYRSDRWEIASASPETFFKVEMQEGVRKITTSPIKGTSRDGHFKDKDSAENVMIVDLMRNDISPLCKIGTVKVPRLLAREEHPGLVHLVSDVVGELRDDASWKEIVERLMPPGSISGAPKSSALEVIGRFEPYRGAYCGTLGWIHKGEAHFSVLIRTFFRDLEAEALGTYFGTGAGITWGSDAKDEWSETELKAERLMAIADRLAGRK